MGKKGKSRLGGRANRLSFRYSKYHHLVMLTHIFRQESVSWSFQDLPLAIIIMAFALSAVITRKKKSSLFNVKVIYHALTTAENYITNLFLFLV